MGFRSFFAKPFAKRVVKKHRLSHQNALERQDFWLSHHLKKAENTSCLQPIRLCLTNKRPPPRRAGATEPGCARCPLAVSLRDRAVKTRTAYALKSNR